MSPSPFKSFQIGTLHPRKLSHDHAVDILRQGQQEVEQLHRASRKTKRWPKRRPNLLTNRYVLQSVLISNVERWLVACVNDSATPDAVEMSSVEESLSTIGNLPQKDRLSAYQNVVSQTLSQPSPSPQDIGRVVASAVQESVGLVVSKQVVADIVEGIKGIKDQESRKDAVEAALDRLSSRETSFDEQVRILREQLADIYEAEEDFAGAAKVLQTIPLDSGSKSNDSVYKLAHYVRIMRLLLEDDDSVTAENFLGRTGTLVNSISQVTATVEEKTMMLHYKTCQARIFDSRRKFLEAAAKYYALSTEGAIDEEERLACLSASLTCAVLGPAGPQRSRMLATLYRDERSSQLSDFSILASVYFDRIIQHSQVEHFASSLRPHQKALLAAPTKVPHYPSDEAAVEAAKANGLKAKKGPEDVLDRAVMEHNLLAASRIYNNITFGGLGSLLGLTPSAAEVMARTMIIQGRLKAEIDQVDGLITFEPSGEPEEAVSNVAAAASGAGGGTDGEGPSQEEEEDKPAKLAPQIARWDTRIRKTLGTVEEVAARIERIVQAAGEARPAVTAVAG